jgi:hypothetical protein
MRKLIVAALLAGSCLALSGCMTFDTEHDRKILGYWKNDMRAMHEDIDFILFMDPDSNFEGSIGDLYLH